MKKVVSGESKGERMVVSEFELQKLVELSKVFTLQCFQNKITVIKTLYLKYFKLPFIYVKVQAMNKGETAFQLIFELEFEMPALEYVHNLQTLSFHAFRLPIILVMGLLSLSKNNF